MSNGQCIALDFDSRPFTPTVIDGAEVLNEIEAFYRRFIVMEEAAYTITALWVVHTYAYKAALWTPYMAVTSAEKRCGKSQYLEVSEYLVRSPLKSDDITSAALFRLIEKYRPTMLLDEQDAAKDGDKEKYANLRAVLNSGAKHNGKVHRMVGKGKDMDVKAFSTFCPKAVAGIGCLADTVADRSMPIRLKRKLAAEKIDYLDEDQVKPIADALSRRISSWAEQQMEKLRGARPQIPQELNDRQKDGSRPLLAIADAVGGDWSAKARAAIVKVHAGTSAQDQSPATLLLSDIRDLFQRLPEVGSLSSAELIEELKKAEHGTWAEYYQGRPIGTRQLSKLLGNFGIGPRTVRKKDETFKGYRRDMFEDAWGRFIPSDPPSPPDLSVTAPQANVYAAETHFSCLSRGGGVTDEKSEESSMLMRVVTAVTDKNGGMTRPGQEKAEKTPPSWPKDEKLCAIHGFHTGWFTEGDVRLCSVCHPGVPHDFPR